MKFLLSILSISLLVFVYGQGKVELSINPKTAEIGEVFSITVTTNVDGPLNFDKVPSTFNQDYAISQGARQEIDYNTGNVTNIYYYTITGLITKAGSYKFGPAYITKGSKSYASNVATINISPRVQMNSGNVSQQQLQDPAFGLIQTNKTTIYEGEPLLVTAKVYAKYNPSHVGNYKSYGLPGTTLKHPIGSTTSFKKSIESYKGHDYYAFNYDKNVIFPSGVGQFQIDPFRMNLHQGYQNFPIISNSYMVNIKPLPNDPPLDFIGAVGDFRLKAAIDESQLNSLKQGDVFKLTLYVAGIGNLQNIAEPKLNLPKGFMVYGDPIVDENYSMGVHGAEGEIKYEYNIEVHKHGKTKIDGLSISYFDPHKESYIQTACEDFELNVKKDAQFIAQHSSRNDTPRNEEVVIHQSGLRNNSDTADAGTLFGSPLFWGGVCSPILAAFFFLFVARRKESSVDKKKSAQQMANRNSELKELLAKTKIGVVDGSSTFFSDIDLTLRTALEIEMQIEESRILNKSEIVEYLKNDYSEVFATKTSQLFSICEQCKYGISDKSISRESMYNDLSQIIDQLKHVK
jgi:hypothetical protein